MTDLIQYIRNSKIPKYDVKKSVPYHNGISFRKRNIVNGKNLYLTTGRRKG